MSDAAFTLHALCELSAAILFRSARLEVVWPDIAALTAIELVFFAIARGRLRKNLASLAQPSAASTLHVRTVLLNNQIVEQQIVDHRLACFVIHHLLNLF